VSALGQKRTFSKVCAMSALPPKADTPQRNFPTADMELIDNREIGVNFLRSLPALRKFCAITSANSRFSLYGSLRGRPLSLSLVF